MLSPFKAWTDSSKELSKKFGDANQLESDGTWDYTYDDEGNLILKDAVGTDEHWIFEYDNANRLIEVKHYNVSNTLDLTANYKYDVLSNRIEKSVDEGAAIITRYAYDGWNPAKPTPIGTENSDAWAEFDVGGSLTIRYVHGDQVDEPIARVEGANARWLLRDEQGSVIVVLSAAGSVLDRINYDAFGNITYELAPTYGGHLLYTSRHYDAETGLYFNRARYYDPQTARWITQDPIKFTAGDVNLYRYVANNATNATDPSGLEDYAVRGDAFYWIVERPGTIRDWDVREFNIGSVVVVSGRDNRRRDVYVRLSTNFGGQSVPIDTVYRAIDEFWQVFPEIADFDDETRMRYIRNAILYQAQRRSIEAEVQEQVRAGNTQVLHRPLYGNSRFDQRLSQASYLEMHIRREIIERRFGISSRPPEGLRQNHWVEWFGPNGHIYELLPAVFAAGAKVAGRNPVMRAAVEPFTPGGPLQPIPINGVGQSRARQIAGYAFSDLGGIALQHRRTAEIGRSGNVVVVEYQLNGIRHIRAFDTVGRAGRHGEFVARDAIPEGATLLRLFTERQPCQLLIPNCDRMLARDFPNVEVSYLVEYGDATSRARGNAALDAMLRTELDE